MVCNCGGYKWGRVLHDAILQLVLILCYCVTELELCKYSPATTAKCEGCGFEGLALPYLNVPMGTFNVTPEGTQ